MPYSKGMTPIEYRALLGALELTPSQAAELLGVSQDEAYRWQTEAKRGRRIPAPAARFLQFLRAAKISPDEVVRMLEKDAL